MSENGSRLIAYKRTIRILLISQLLAGAGLAAGMTVGALLVEDMTGATGITGLPVALFILGSAIASKLVGNLSERSGRRIGLSAGYFVGAVGAAGIVLAALLNNLPLLFAALLLYGSGAATNLQARYAGADLAEPRKRGQAISVVLVATTAGAVLGPNLINVTGSIAQSMGVRELAGPFMLAALAYGLAALVIFVLMRPDPLLAARAMSLSAATQAKGQKQAADIASGSTVLSVQSAAAAMILTQLVMVAIMTMAPIHLKLHGQSLSAIGLVISIHIAAMYLPSLITGRLVDRFGSRRILGTAAFVLLAAGLVAAAAPADSVIFLALALGLLGLGWNFGLVAGSSAITQAAPLKKRASIQGSVDLTVSLAGAAGGLSSGFVVAGSSYAALSLAGGILGLLILPFVFTRRVVKTTGQ